MRIEQIVVGGYYALTDYSKMNERVYKVRYFNRCENTVEYDYYDGRGIRIGGGSTKLDAFAESVGGRVKPKKRISNLQKYLSERKWNY